MNDVQFEIGDVSVASSEEETNAVNAAFVELSLIASSTDGNPEHTLRFLRGIYRRGFIDACAAMEVDSDEPEEPKA